MTVNAENSGQSALQHPRLEVRRVLGAGGMGVVHAAYDPLLEREVAVKVIRVTGAASGARARILREARAIARISHPNVVHVYSADAFDDQVAIVMELVQGQTLRQWLEAKRTWQEIVAVFVEAGRGLAAAHDAGLVHRDFKPDNVMVRSDGRVCVLDFGLARALEAQAADGSTVPLTPDTARALSAETTVTLEASAAIDHASPADAHSRVTVTGALVGTPLYMAPEQHRGAPTDARADQFAFCVALYRALFGQHPFDDTTYATLVTSVGAGAYRPPPTGASVPARVVAALRRGLAATPGQRFPSLRLLLPELVARPEVRRGRRVALGFLLAAAVGGGWLTLRGATEPQRRARAPAVADRTRLTMSGDISWAGVSHDERWLALGKTDGEFVLRDLAGQNRDRVIYKGAPQPECEPSWSWDSRAVIVELGTAHTQILSVDPAVKAIEVPLGGCAVFTSPTEVAAYWLQRRDLRFWDISTGVSRSCPLPGDDSWVTGLHARPGQDRLLLTTFNDRFHLLRLWSMRSDCSDATLLASIPHPKGDGLGRISRQARGWWGRGTHEVIAAMPSKSPPAVQFLSISTVAPHTQTQLLTTASTGHFSVGRSGVIYAVQGDSARQLWQKTPSGEFTRLVNDSRVRLLGSFTPAGDKVFLLEETEQGRAMRAMTVASRELTTVSEYDGTGLVPYEVAVSARGAIAIIGSRDDVPTIHVVDSDGRDVDLGEAAKLGSGSMTWAGETLLLHLPGNRNYAVLNDGKRRTADLLADPRLGWALSASGSPDGDTVAFYANRGRAELRTVSVASGTERLIGHDAIPIGWSADGKWIYATVETAPDRVVRFPATGGPPEAWMDIPKIGRARARASPTGDVLLTYNTEQVDAYSFLLP